VSDSTLASLPIITVDSAPPAAPPQSRRLPPWLRQNLAPGGGHAETAHLIAELGLETVCSSAKCPNRLECWSSRTATFMILGNVCTRPCGFCSVPKGKTEELEHDEPERVAEAAKRLGLKHVVITSVTRDDLPDGGAEHFRRTVDAVRAATGAAIEVLVPDFIGKDGALERLMEAKPDVFNHNTETVPRLYRTVRGRKSHYPWTLQLLADAKRVMPEVKTKSGLMLGLGETRDELLDVFTDLLDHGVALGARLNCLNKRIQVNHHELKRFDAQFGQLVLVLNQAHVSQEAAVNLWVKRFDATVECFGKTGHLGHLGHSHAGIGNGFCC